MATTTEIANLAISHLGLGKEIANLDTDKSQDAVTIRRYYDQSRDAALRAFAWPFATQFATLGLVASPPNETDEWDFAYRYPSDCLVLRRLQSGLRRDTSNTRVVYKVGRDSQGALIYTDLRDAKVEYTFREEDPSRYPPDFILALSFLLASYAAPRLTGGDPFKMGNRAIQMYFQHISMAEGSAANEAVQDPIPDSEFIRVREGDVSAPTVFTPGQ